MARIAERLGVSINTVSKTLKRLEAQGHDVPHAMTGRPRKDAKARARKKAQEAKDRIPTPKDPVADQIASIATTVAPEDIGPQLLHVVGSEYLPAIQRMVRDAIAEGHLARMRDAIRLEIEIKQRVINAVPPPPPDPEDDPLYRTAKARLIAKAKRIVERAKTGDPTT